MNYGCTFIRWTSEEQAVGADHDITIPNADLAFSTEAPTADTTEHRDITVPVKNLSLSTVIPTADTTAHHTRAPPKADLAFSTEAPTAVSVAPIEITVPAANLSFSTAIPTSIREVVHTIGNNGQDYSSAAAWESAQQSSPADETRVGKIVTTGTESGVVQITGWTTRTGGNYIILGAEGDGHHGGSVLGDTGYIFTGSIFSTQADSACEGLIVFGSSGGEAFQSNAAPSALGYNFSNCISNREGGGGHGFSGNGQNYVAIGCVAIGTQGAGSFGFESNGSSLDKFYNCTAYDCVNGVGTKASSTADIELYNCVFIGNGTSDIDNTEANTVTATNTAYNSTTGVITDGGGNITGALITATDTAAADTILVGNVTAGSEDLALKQFSTITTYQNAALVAGTDYRSTFPVRNPLQYAIDGEWRNTVPNIGAYETCIKEMTVHSSTGDFSAAETWNTTRVTSNATERLKPTEIFADTTRLDFSGTAANYDYNRRRELIVDLAYRHDGTRGSGYRITPTTVPNAVDVDNSNCVTIVGVEATVLSPNNDEAFRFTPQGDGQVLVDSCLAYDVDRAGFYIQGRGNTQSYGQLHPAALITNCIAYGCNSDDWPLSGNFYMIHARGIILRNCTSINDEAATEGGINIGSGATIALEEISNCISMGSTSSDFQGYTDARLAFNNVSEDATAFGTGALINIENLETGGTPTKDYVAFADNTAGTEDAHLVDLAHGTYNNVAIDGANATYAPQKDADGEQRHVPDIGAYEIPESADITVPFRSLTISTEAPTVDLSDVGDTITPPKADLAFSTEAPTVDTTANQDVTVPKADLAFSTEAPTPLTSLHLDITVPNDDLAFSTEAPTVDTTANQDVTVPNADLAFSTEAPTVDTTANQDVTVPNADLAFSTAAPTADTTEHRDIEAPKADLAISTAAPTADTSANKDIEVPKADLAFSTAAPTADTTANQDVTVPNADLAFSTEAPTVDTTANQDVTVPNADLAFSTEAPTVDEAEHQFVEVPNADIAISTVAPTADTSEDQFVTPPKADLAFSTEAPGVRSSIEPPKADLVFSTEAPDVQSGDNVTKNPPKVNLNLSTVAPTADTTEHRDIEAPKADLAFSTAAPTADTSANKDIEVPKADLAFSTAAPTADTSANKDIEAPKADLAFSTAEPTADTTEHRDIEAPKADLAFSTAAPTADTTEHRDIEVPKADLAFSTAAPTADTSANKDIEVPKADLAFSTAAPTADTTTTTAFPTLYYYRMRL
jgi:hypothetical protein